MDAKPFLGTEALAAGSLTRRTLASRHDAIYRNVYVEKGADVTASTRAVAAWLWAGRDATIGGLSAAALYGSKWIDPHLPAEVFRRNGKPAKGILIHRDELLDGESRSVRGISVTTPTRTALDLGRREGLTKAVIRLDALANATGLKPDEVSVIVDKHRGVRGVNQLRQALDLMDDGAESPQETRTRLLLLAAGFPRPQTQIMVCDPFGYLIGRIDIGWSEWNVGVEYDGPQHWATSAEHAHTIERIVELEAQGWTIIRLSRDILRYRSGIFFARVGDAMRVAGWPDYERVRLDVRLGP